jgi:hypothetical protein
MWRKEINALQEDIVKGVLKGSLSILTERVDVAVEEFQLEATQSSLPANVWNFGIL